MSITNAPMSDCGSKTVYVVRYTGCFWEVGIWVGNNWIRESSWQWENGAVVHARKLNLEKYG